MPQAQRHAVASVQAHTVHAVMIASLHCKADERDALRGELIRTLVAACVPFDPCDRR